MERMGALSIAAKAAAASAAENCFRRAIAHSAFAHSTYSNSGAARVSLRRVLASGEPFSFTTHFSATLASTMIVTSYLVATTIFAQLIECGGTVDAADLRANRVEPPHGFFPRQPDGRRERTTRFFLHGCPGLGRAPPKRFKHCIVDVSNYDLAHFHHHME